MKVNSRLIALMVAMAAGTAAAAGAGLTPAGTVIRNTATASFTDPSTGNAATPVVSNEVQTRVLPQPGFDINYTTAPTDDGTKGDDSATNKIPGSYKEANAIPGKSYTQLYNAVNTGNIGAYVVNLTPDFLDSPVLLTATDVKYYPKSADTTPDGVLSDVEIAAATPITFVTLPVDDLSTPLDEGLIQFFQVVKVPATAAIGAIYAVSPRGSNPGGNVVTNPVINGTPTTFTDAYGPVNETDNDNDNDKTTPIPTGYRDLQYAKLTVLTPVVTVNPPDLGTPPTTVTVPPSDPNNTVNPPSTTPPGYTDPTNPSTPIWSRNDEQTAFPPADTNATNDSVTFINKVTNGDLLNADRISLFPVIATVSGAPLAGITFDATTSTFTLPAYTTVDGIAVPAGTTMQFLKNDGSKLDSASNAGDGKTYPYVDLAANGSGTYRVVVTYPDSNPNAITSDPTKLQWLVGGDSNNDSDINSNDTTKLTVYPAAMVFGDATPALGTTPVPAPIQTVRPQGLIPTTTAGVIGSPDSTDATAVFPMDITNFGEYADTYTLTPAVLDFPNTAGGLSQATVRYYDSNGPLPLVAGKYVTPVVASNTEYKVWAVVDVPSDAKATGTPILVPQTAVGTYSTVSASDNNDQILVAVSNTNPGPPIDPLIDPPIDPLDPPEETNPASGISVKKYQAVNGTVPTPPTSSDRAILTALPGDTLRYAIVAKNNFNADVKNFVLSDITAGSTNVYTFSNFKSASATALLANGTTTFGTVIYKVNNGAWSTTAPVSPAAPAAPLAVTSLQVGVDTNGDTDITAADIVPALASIRLNIEVTVK